MPSFHLKHSSAPSPARPSTTHASFPSSPEPQEMQLKGVKRIVSGLRRRISSLSIRGHRHHESSADDAHPSPFLLDVVPGEHPHPITLPITAREHYSEDTLVRSVPASGLVKHASDPEDSSSSSSHSRSSSSASSSSDAPFHQAHSEVPRSEAGSSVSSLEQSPRLAAVGEETTEGDRSSRLSARFPPPEPLTAPIETLVFHDERSSSLRSRKYSLASIESLTAPLETLVLFQTETAPRGAHISIEPWCIPLPGSPATEPWSIPLPDSLPDSPRIIPMDPLGVSLTEDIETASNDVPIVLVEGNVPAEESLTSTLDSQLTSSMEFARETPLVSPPPPVGEPEVPNPFLEDPDAHSSDGERSETPEEPQTGLSVQPASSVIELAPTPATPRTPDLNKSVPTTPTAGPALASDDEDEEDVPELYLPGLTLPTMFLPIPNVRYPLFSSLTWWFSKSLINYPLAFPLHRRRLYH